MPRGVKAVKPEPVASPPEVATRPGAALRMEIPKTPVSSKSGKLAAARAAGAKALKKPVDEWKVTLDYEQLKEPLPHLPTGSLIIDYLIGGELNRFGVAPCPGLPRSRISQLWGHESAGKTTLALTAAATTIKRGGTVLYIDWENDIVPDYAMALGIPIGDDDKFELVQPDTLEDGLKLAMVYAAAGVDLIVFDSVGAAVPNRIASRESSEVAEQSRVGELQAIWSQELPNLKKVINKSGTHVLGISQIRAKIATGPAHGGPTTQPQGGNAWKFYSALRMELRRIKKESSKLHNALTHKTDDRVTGGVIQCEVMKCKLSRSQGRKEVFYIRWGDGIDDLRSIMEIAISYGVIKKGGAWLSWETPEGESIKVQGINALRDHLQAHPAHIKVLYSAVIPFLGNQQFDEEDLEEINADVIFAEDAEELAPDVDLSEPE